MSHPDPCYDPDNSYEDDMNYDDHNDFWGLPENELDELRDQMSKDEGHDEEDEESDFDESMDGDFESGMASAGWGTDEDYE